MFCLAFAISDYRNMFRGKLGAALPAQQGCLCGSPEDIVGHLLVGAADPKRKSNLRLFDPVPFRRVVRVSHHRMDTGALEQTHGPVGIRSVEKSRGWCERDPHAYVWP